MKFGLFSLFDFFPDRQNEVRYYQDTLDLVIRAEQLGFDSVWLGEEHFYSFGICPSPQLFLTALARETATLRLGTAVSLLTFENPLRKAEDFAMLDILSGGRLDFGAGRGSIPKHFEGFRVSPQESRARYEEALAIIRQAWTSDRFSYQGEFWQIPELSLSPKPVQHPHPPIYRGTLSPESFDAAAAAGDNAFVLPWLTGPHPVVRQRVERYRALLTEHGHSGQQMTFIFLLFVDHDRQRAIAEAKTCIRNYIDLGFARGLREGIAQLGVGGPALQAFFEHIESTLDHLEERAIVGTPHDCRRRLAELRDEFGMEQVAFYLHAGARDPARAKHAMEVFAQEVMPEFA